MLIHARRTSRPFSPCSPSPAPLRRSERQRERGRAAPNPVTRFDPTGAATRRCSRRSTFRVGNDVPQRQRRPRAEVLAAARRLRPARHARHRGESAARRDDASLHQQLAGHAALRLVPGRAERVQERVAQLVRLPRRLAFRRAQLRGRRLHRPLQSGRGAKGAKGRASAQDARRRHGDEGRPRDAATAGADDDVRRRVALQHSRARRRPHGARRRAVRARAMVSARLRLRRSARLEHRAVPRPGRVLSRVRRLQPLGDRARRLHRRRDGHAAERRRGADADRDLASRAGGEVRNAGAHHHAGRAEERRRAAEEDAACSPGGSRRRTFATPCGPRRPTTCGTRRAGRATWRSRYYRPSAIEPWKDAADMSRMSIKEYSERWFQYPYPQISAVEGPISGMEYPMVAMEDEERRQVRRSTTSSRTRSGTCGTR